MAVDFVKLVRWGSGSTTQSVSRLCMVQFSLVVTPGPGGCSIKWQGDGDY